MAWRPITRRPQLGLVTILVALAAAPAPAATSPSKVAPDGQVRLVTPPAHGDALTIARTYLAARHTELGLVAADIETLELERQYHTDGLGTNLFFQQEIGGVPVFHAVTSVHVLDSGAILAVNNSAVAAAAAKVSARQPVVTAAQAYAIALRRVGKTPGEAVPLATLDPDRQGVVFSGEGATRRPVPVQLIYVEGGGQLRLAWELYVMTSGSEVWYLLVDAVDGKVLREHNLVTELNRYRAYPFNSESPLSTETPTDLHHDLVPELGDVIASPQGWVSASTTTGNNVVAVEDRDDDDFNGFQPVGTGTAGSLTFDFAHDDTKNPCEQPSATAAVQTDPNLQPCDPYNAAGHNSNLEAAIVNLFYWNNVVHDVMVHYGFTEEAGNFQKTNFTGGAGRGNDPVLAQAQDGSGLNNANFFTPPDDGQTPIWVPPAMQMYEWAAPPTVRVDVPSSFQDFDDGDNLLSAAAATFGAALDALPEPARSGDLEVADDGSIGGGGTVDDGCEPLVGFTPGNIAVLVRGVCEYGVKVRHAEQAGAKAAIITNTLGREVGVPMGPGAAGGEVTIPSVMVGETNGNRLRAAIAAGRTQVTLLIPPVANRDSDLDAGVIAHEYGHGISNRLVGGPTLVTCLTNGQAPDPSTGTPMAIGEQMGEGWSDFFALALTAQPSDTADTRRGVGAYVSFQREDGIGVRRYPYSRNMTVNPLTYGDLPQQPAPHGVGAVWAAMIWDMYWNLVDVHGYEPDLLASTADAGNVRALHYVMQGLVLTRCQPSFVEARNAILAAEAADGDDEDACAIWQAFARRGLGVGAASPSDGSDHREVVEDFTLPASCAGAGSAPFADGFESGDLAMWDGFRSAD